MLASLLVALACFAEEASGAVAPSLVEDSTCALQLAVSAEEKPPRSFIPSGAAAAGGAATRVVDPCAGAIKLPYGRTEVTNNLGGLGPTEGPPVLHISPFLELADGRHVDITIANLSEYGSNNPGINGDVGDFLNLNMKAGFVDLLVTFTDTETGVGVTMPPFNMTIYDLDGPGRDPYAETVMIDSFDFTDYHLSSNTDVVVSVIEDKTHFGGSKLGEGCDNPTSIETLGTVVCNKSGTVDQADRAVALTMKGGVPSYHLSLQASNAVTHGRNFLFGIPSYFNQVCKVATPSPTFAPTPSPPTSAPSASPTSAPTHSPSASPTNMPTTSPTSAPTHSPTQTPTDAPTHSPTPSPTDAPTASPTSAPTQSPTATPTDSPTHTPTASPTHAPTDSPTASPTNLPTTSPTSAPTGATSFGDPHVSNLKGQRFEILQPDYHTFLVIPRGVEEDKALLQVVAKVDPLGDPCSGLLFVTGLRFSGRWLGEVRSLDFSTRVDAEMIAEKAITIKAGSSPALNISQFRTMVPAVLAEVTELQPKKPEYLNQHVTTLKVKLMLGPAISNVWMVYQREKAGFSNSLWLSTTGLQLVDEEVGGILGFDEHDHAASKPAQCSQSNNSAALASYRRSRRGTMMAEALW